MTDVVSPELLKRAQGKDREAMQAVLVALAPQMERFGRRLCGGASPDVEDALQEALVLVARHLGEFEGRSALSSWVFALVRTACTRQRRGLKRQPHEPLEAAGTLSAPSTPETALIASEARAGVVAALDALPAEQREVLALRDIEGLSADEAAQALGISVAALKSRLHRARAALRQRLTPVWQPGALPPEASCPDVAQAMSAKLEDDLSADACKLLEAHVAGCQRCGAVCDTLKQATLVCHQLNDAPTAERTAQLGALVRRALDTEWEAGVQG